MQNSNRLVRVQQDQMIAGVCTGLAQYFAFDVTLVRLAFVLVTLAGGSGILLYIILWAVLPVVTAPGLPSPGINSGLDEMRNQAANVFNKVKTAVNNAQASNASTAVPQSDWKFDPQTGQPINPTPAPAQPEKPRFDPYTGQPLND
ncbi:PspC domain-containing protein [Herpetosiphon llansteffanensis]|uniref:PspC domain-containing protein n=1 Tax=Herpetosiphon llansteffanensis TaxID=2094568 RepID=UPI000D7D15E7|nr:PspC domain-containing protein [Herpetosiphon llansteffanensis]